MKRQTERSKPEGALWVSTPIPGHYMSEYMHVQSIEIKEKEITTDEW